MTTEPVLLGPSSSSPSQNDSKLLRAAVIDIIRHPVFALFIFLASFILFVVGLITAQDTGDYVSVLFVIAAVIFVISFVISLNIWIGREYEFPKWLKTGTSLVSILCIPTVVFVWVCGVFLFIPWLYDSRNDMVIDGKSFVATKTQWMNPFAHDIRVVPKFIGIQAMWVTGVTKDGVPVGAHVTTTLKRLSSPENWLAAPLDTNELLARKFQESCAATTSEEISRSGLKLEIGVGLPGTKWPDSITPTGTIMVQNIHVYIK